MLVSLFKTPSIVRHLAQDAVEILKRRGADLGHEIPGAVRRIEAVDLRQAAQPPHHGAR